MHQHSACMNRYSVNKGMDDWRDTIFSSLEFSIESSTGLNTWYMFFDTADPPQINSFFFSFFKEASCPVLGDHGVCCDSPGMALEELFHPICLLLGLSIWYFLPREV